jgi:uncharacterized protein YndB with AHSA1/START domain
MDINAIEGQVLAVEPRKALSYAWEAMGLKSVVTWTLTATHTDTHLSQIRMAELSRGP